MSRESETLVGDVGGTHARFAIIDTAKKPFAVEQRVDFGAQNFDSFQAVLQAYLERVGADQPNAAAVAVAGPVTDGQVQLTNRGWHLSEHDLRELGFKQALLIN